MLPTRRRRGEKRRAAVRLFIYFFFSYRTRFAYAVTNKHTISSADIAVAVAVTAAAAAVPQNVCRSINCAVFCMDDGDNTRLSRAAAAFPIETMSRHDCAVCVYVVRVCAVCAFRSATGTGTSYFIS